MGSDEVTAHEPVLLAEALELLAVKPGGSYVDGTLGSGGHARAVLAACAPDGVLFGVDRDGEALERARVRLADAAARIELRQADFRELPELLDARSRPPDGILLDLGIGSHQLDDPERGFSFRHDGPLDMRMDRSTGRTAADVVNRLSQRELADVIFQLGEERASRRIARVIVEARRRSPLRTTAQLAGLVRSAARRSRPGLDAATRTFQALRIFVNQELARLAETIVALAERLGPGGRLVVIAFHSLEDREVKLATRDLASRGYRSLTRKPLRASEPERRRNPRSRSARLRAVERPVEVTG